MADTEIKEGDQVSWQWAGGRPGGEATEVKQHGEMKMETKRGNEVKKNADPENPAVKISRSGQDVVKRASELEVDELGPKHDEGGDSKEDDEKEETNLHEKRKAENDKEDKKGEKKQKTDDAPTENGEKAAPKKKSRAGKNANGESKKAEPKKKREPKKAATESGEPRRSARNAK